MRLRRVGLQRWAGAQILFSSEFHHITGTALFMFLRECLVSDKHLSTLYRGVL